MLKLQNCGKCFERKHEINIKKSFCNFVQKIDTVNGNIELRLELNAEQLNTSMMKCI